MFKLHILQIFWYTTGNNLVASSHHRDILGFSIAIDNCYPNISAQQLYNVGGTKFSGSVPAAERNRQQTDLSMRIC